MKIKGQARQGHIAMLVFSALVAGSFSLGARAANHMDPAALTALRLPLAALVLGIAAWASGGLTRTALKAPWRYLVMGGLMTTYFVLMFEGLKTATPVSAAAVFTLTPVMAGAFGWLVMRQRMTGRVALALGLGASGALWVIFRGEIAALARMAIGQGEAIYFWGCAAHALYAAIVPRLNRGESAVTFAFGTMLAGALLLLPIALPELLRIDWGAVPAVVWVTLLYVSVAASAITTALVQYAALRLPASKVMAYTYLIPSWVILWEAKLGAGLPPALVVPGIVLTCVALLLLLKDDALSGRRSPV